MATKLRSIKPKTSTTTTAPSLNLCEDEVIKESRPKMKTKVKKEKSIDKESENNNSSSKQMLSLSPSSSSTKINEEGIEDLRTAFRLLDKNSDGRVSTAEMQSMLKAFGIDVPYKHVRRLVDSVSSIGASKGITESDFIDWVTPLLLETAQEHEEKYSGRSDIEQDLLAAFEIFDKDRNGYITKDELKRAMELIGEEVDDEELDEMLDLGDVDKDGQIDYGEFAKILS